MGDESSGILRPGESNVDLVVVSLEKDLEQWSTSDSSGDLGVSDGGWRQEDDTVVDTLTGLQVIL